MITENNQDGAPADNGGESPDGAENQATVEKLQAKLTEAEANAKTKDETLGSLKRELKDAKKALEDSKRPNEPSQQQSNEPDYSRLAYLEAKQITHADDQKIVMDEAERLKLPLTDVLQMEHIKAKLQSAKNQRNAQDGTPSGAGRKGSTQKDIDFYLNRPDEIPEDLELAEKVIEARIKKQKMDNQFSSIPVIG